MTTSSLRRWCKPRTTLVISNAGESPARTLEVVSRVRATGARVFLAQLPGMTCSIRSPYLVFDWATRADKPSVNGAHQAFLWAEILSEVTVLKNMAMERVPAFAESLGADQVVLTTPAIGFARFRTKNGAETDLLRSLTVPILIFGVRQAPSAWKGSGFCRILLPISFGPDLGLQLRFACRFARRHHGRVTVLHVFESGGTNECAWERTPVAVEAKLPISELKHEGILCPLEITVCEGYPARKILSFNEKRPHDLIIMGGPSSSNSIYSMGHSLAETVIAEARCPVLVLGGAIGSDSVSMEPISQLTLA